MTVQHVASSNMQHPLKGDMRNRKQSYQRSCHRSVSRQKIKNAAKTAFLPACVLITVVKNGPLQISLSDADLAYVAIAQMTKSLEGASKFYSVLR